MVPGIHLRDRVSVLIPSSMQSGGAQAAKPHKPHAVGLTGLEELDLFSVLHRMHNKLDLFSVLHRMHDKLVLCLEQKNQVYWIVYRSHSKLFQ